MTLFDGTRFFGFAREVSTSDWGLFNEAAARSSVSRAYYAVFHAARERLRSERVAIGLGPEAHGQIIDALEQSGERVRLMIGSRLRTLRKRRNAADYEDFGTFSRGDVDAELKIAEDLLRAIRELPREG